MSSDALVRRESVVFGPDLDHTIISPATLTVVSAHPTAHVVARKTIDTVLVEAQETDVVSSQEHTVFGPKTLHQVVFRPPR